MTLEQADSVPPYIQLDRPMKFQGGPIRATIDPQRLSIPDVLQRADIFVLRMIAESFGRAADLLQPHVGGLRQRARAGQLPAHPGTRVEGVRPPAGPSRTR